MSLSPELKSKIQSMLAAAPVVLFMKGTRERPTCGFSSTAVEILDLFLADYSTVNVLEDPELREGLKEFAKWPTYPQLWVRGELVGGADIMREMFENDELGAALGMAASVSASNMSASTLNLRVSDSALQAMADALKSAGEGEAVRITIDARFNQALSFDVPKKNDVALELGLAGDAGPSVKVLLDPMSASRAAGLKVDHHGEIGAGGFELKNPNGPPEVQDMSVQTLKDKLGRAEALHLFDVRTRAEWNEGRIAGARLFAEIPSSDLAALPKDALLVFQCRSGVRSARTAEQFRQRGYTNVHNLTGGIMSWQQSGGAVEI
jgi:monothiol glutaredoxin